MKKKKTIILWGHDDLLSSAVEHILKTHKDWEVVNISQEEDIEQLIQSLDTVYPDILIINKELGNDYAHFLVHALQEHPEIRIVTINFENNSMELFSKTKGWISEKSDFLMFLEQECT